MGEPSLHSPCSFCLLSSGLHFFTSTPHTLLCCFCAFPEALHTLCQQLYLASGILPMNRIGQWALKRFHHHGLRLSLSASPLSHTLLMGRSLTLVQDTVEPPMGPMYCGSLPRTSLSGPSSTWVPPPQLGRGGPCSAQGAVLSRPGVWQTSHG